MQYLIEIVTKNHCFCHSVTGISVSSAMHKVFLRSTNMIHPKQGKLNSLQKQYDICKICPIVPRSARLYQWPALSNQQNVHMKNTLCTASAKCTLEKHLVHCFTKVLLPYLNECGSLIYFWSPPPSFFFFGGGEGVSTPFLQIGTC